MLKKLSPKEELVSILHSRDTIPGLKTLQPWASLLITSEKKYDIRGYDNKQRGWTAILASGWDDSFGANHNEHPFFCLIGFCKLVGTKQYQTHAAFDNDYQFHRNPSNRYLSGCFAWRFEHPIQIIPLYYQHAKNEDKEFCLPLIGQMARCRIATKDLRNRLYNVKREDNRI
jgi:hypothetical protein